MQIVFLRGGVCSIANNCFWNRKHRCYVGHSLQSADVFPVIASLPPKNTSFFSEGEKRRPEIRLRFAGYVVNWHKPRDFLPKTVRSRESQIWELCFHFSYFDIKSCCYHFQSHRRKGIFQEV